MGAFAAGAGAYNEQTAQARAMNANTAMQLNNYIYGVNVQRAQNYSQRQDAKIQETTATADATYRRLHDNPNSHDIRTGDALNVVLEELTNPKVYTQVVQKATQPVPSALVKNIVFQYAANMIAITLEDFSSRGVPDVLLTTPAYEPDRNAFKALVARVRQETSSPGGQVSAETLAKCRSTIKALQTKVEGSLTKGTRDYDEAENFLKALYGLTKMLQTPDVPQFLKGLDKEPTTTLGHLVTFMHNFNLRFGATKTAEQGAAYDQLYPLLATLRDQANAQGPNPMTVAVPPQDPKAVSTFFSGMHYNHFQPQPDPHTGVVPPPPPPPGQPK
jgi:hypothetical protein